jgi:Ca2+-binding RTX toxin-like protein
MNGDGPNNGRDHIVAGAGNDAVNAGRGNDFIKSGSGRDFVNVRGNGRDTVRCGRGKDRVKADRRDRIARDCEVVELEKPSSSKMRRNKGHQRS